MNMLRNEEKEKKREKLTMNLIIEMIEKHEK
jgi:hypothetical protein